MRVLILAAFIASAVATTRPGDVGAQDSSIAVRFDSLSRRMLVSRHPCPDPVPQSWTIGNESNGAGVRCSLVMAAANGVMSALQARGRTDWDPWNALCVTLDPAKPVPSLPPLWRVAFYTDSLRGVEVHVDDYGRTFTVRMFVDLEVPLKRACKEAD